MRIRRWVSMLQRDGGADPARPGPGGPEIRVGGHRREAAGGEPRPGRSLDRAPPDPEKNEPKHPTAGKIVGGPAAVSLRSKSGRGAPRDRTRPARPRVPGPGRPGAVGVAEGGQFLSVDRDPGASHGVAPARLAIGGDSGCVRRLVRSGTSRAHEPETALEDEDRMHWPAAGGPVPGNEGDEILPGTDGNRVLLVGRRDGRRRQGRRRK